MMKMSDLKHITNSTLPYLLSVPSGSKPIEGWPLLCFLHGYDEAADRGAIKEAVTKHGPLHPDNPSRVLNEFIVVAPQMPIAGDNWHKFPHVVKEIVNNVRKDYDADPHKFYLTGFSYGGNGVFDLTAIQPNFWAALWPVDPTKVPPKDLELPIWVSIGAAARRSTSGYIKTLKLQPASDVQNLDRVYLDEAMDHVGSARKAYKDTRIYDWLLSHRLENVET